jgi:hypothetical protein
VSRAFTSGQSASSNFLNTSRWDVFKSAWFRQQCSAIPRQSPKRGRFPPFREFKSESGRAFTDLGSYLRPLRLMPTDP